MYNVHMHVTDAHTHTSSQIHTSSYLTAKAQHTIFRGEGVAVSIVVQGELMVSLDHRLHQHTKQWV